MRKVKYQANYGYAGTDVEDELEYPDGATDEEIEEDIKEIVMQRVDWYWEPVNQHLEMKGDCNKKEDCISNLLLQPLH